MFKIDLSTRYRVSLYQPKRNLVQAVYLYLSLIEQLLVLHRQKLSIAVSEDWVVIGTCWEFIETSKGSGTTVQCGDSR